MAKIPDISHYHRVTNWNKVKKNCPFIVTKATQGTAFVDSTLKSVIKGCESYKIPYYLYVYLNRGNERAQAEFMVETCKPLIGPYFRGYVLDVEAGNDADNVKEALDYINSQSYKTMIYTAYKDYAKYRKVIESRGGNCAWWEARYGTNSGTYKAKYPSHTGVDLHQYTSNGACAGIAGLGDLNRLTGRKPMTWYTAGKPAGAKAAVKKAVKKAKAKATRYSKVHTYPALPPRGYYMIGDGYKTLTNYTIQIKRVQTLCNYAGYTCTIDGDYGQATKNAVTKLQKAMGVVADGIFGGKTLSAAKEKFR